MKKNVKRKKLGISHVDWVIALFLFLTAVAIAFTAIQQGTYRSDLGEITKELSISLASDLNAKTSWTLNKEKIVVKANSSLEWPLELVLNLTDSLDANSVIVVDDKSALIATDYDTNETKVIFDSSLGTEKNFFVIYGKNTSLSKIQFNTSLNVTEGSASFNFSTSKINGTATTTGLSDIKWSNSLLLNSATLNVANAKPSNKTGQVRAKFVYDDANVSVYHNSSKIHVDKNQSETITFSTTTSLVDKYYNGTVVDLPSQADGTVNSGTFDWIGFYKEGGNGFSIIGNDMSVVVSKSSSTITTTISGVTKFEIFLHAGNYTNAATEKDSFFDEPEITVKNPLKLAGISKENAETLETKTYDSLKDELGTNFNFNYTIDDISISLGTQIPEDRTVIVQRFPSARLDRYGNITSVKVAIAIWH